MSIPSKFLHWFRIKRFGAILRIWVSWDWVKCLACPVRFLRTAISVENCHPNVFNQIFLWRATDQGCSYETCETQVLWFTRSQNGQCWVTPLFGPRLTILVWKQSTIMYLFIHPLSDQLTDAACVWFPVHVHRVSLCIYFNILCESLIRRTFRAGILSHFRIAPILSVLLTLPVSTLCQSLYFMLSLLGHLR